MSNFPNSSSFRGILRNPEQRSISDSGDLYSEETHSQFSRNAAHMPIYMDSDISSPSDSYGTSQSAINAKLYQEALVAKSNLGLLDSTVTSSALESLRSYGSFAQSPHGSPKRSHHSGRLELPNQFGNVQQQSRSSLYPTSTHALSSYDHSMRQIENSNRISAPISGITSVSSLSTVDDEDHFLYGDSDPVPDNSFNPIESVDRISLEAPIDDDIIEIENPNTSRMSVNPSSNFKAVNINFSNNLQQNSATWNANTDALNFLGQVRSLKDLERSVMALKQNVPGRHIDTPVNTGQKETIAQTMANYSQSRESLKGKQGNILTIPASQLQSQSINFPTLQQIHAVKDTENISRYATAANILRKQLNLDKPIKEQFLTEKTSNIPDKGVSGINEKILINVKQGQDKSSKRVVHIKDDGSFTQEFLQSSTQKPSSPSIDALHSNRISPSKQLLVNEVRRVIRDRSAEIAAANAVEESNVPKQYAHKDSDQSDSRHVEKKPESLVKEKLKLSVAEKRKIDSQQPSSKVKHKTVSPDNGRQRYDARCRSPGASRYRSPESSRRRSPDYSRRRSPDSSWRKSPDSPRRRSPDSSKYRKRSPDRYHPSDHRYRDYKRSSDHRDRRHRDDSPGHRYRSRRQSPDRYYRDYSPRRGSRESSEHSSIPYSRHSFERSPDRCRKNSRDRSPIVQQIREKISGHTDVKSSSPTLKSTQVRKRAYDSSPDSSSSEEDWTPPDKRSTASPLPENDPMKCSSSSDFAKPGSSEPTHFKRSKTVHEVAEAESSVSKIYSDPVAKLMKELGVDFGLQDSNENVTSSATKETINQKSTLEQFGVPLDLPNPSKQNMNLEVKRQQMSSSQVTGPDLTQYPPNIQAYSQQGMSLQHQAFPHQFSGYPSYTVPVNTSVPPPLPFVPNYPPPTIQANTHPFYSDATNLYQNQPVLAADQTLVTKPPLPGPRNLSNLKSINLSTASNDAKIEKFSDTPPPSSSATSAPVNITHTRTVSFKNSVPQPSTSGDAMISKYVELKEEQELLKKRITNTTNVAVEFNAAMRTMDRKLSVTRMGNSKQLKMRCSIAQSRMNDDLGSLAQDYRRLREEIILLKAQIPPASMKNVENKQMELKKEKPNVVYTGFDKGGHWCDTCFEQFPTVAKMIGHIFTEKHIKDVDPFKSVSQRGLPKSNPPANCSPQQVKGLEFIKPLYAYYCTLCDECLVDKAWADHHVRGHDHIAKYMEMSNESPAYEMKLELCKEMGVLIANNERRKRDLDDIALVSRLQQTVKRLPKNESDYIKKDEPKAKEKIDDDLEDCIANAHNSPSAPVSGIKLTLAKEKEKKIKPTEMILNEAKKEPEKKKPQAVVYIGRAPNYKVRSKATDKKITMLTKSSSSSSMSPESVDTIRKNDAELKHEEKNTATVEAASYKTSSPRETVKTVATAPKSDIKTDRNKEKNSSVKESVSSSHVQAMPAKKAKVASGCQSMKEAIGSKQKPIKKTTSAVHQDPLSNIPLPQPAVPVNKQPQNTMQIAHGTYAIEVSHSLKTPMIPPMNIIKSTPPPQKPNLANLSEEEKDLWLLNICKSDLKPIAVPKPPPFSLIRPPDIMPSLPPFPPPLLVPPPSLVLQQSSNRQVSSVQYSPSKALHHRQLIQIPMTDPAAQVMDMDIDPDVPECNIKFARPSLLPTPQKVRPLENVCRKSSPYVPLSSSATTQREKETSLPKPTSTSTPKPIQQEPSVVQPAEKDIVVCKKVADDTSLAIGESSVAKSPELIDSSSDSLQSSSECTTTAIGVTEEVSGNSVEIKPTLTGITDANNELKENTQIVTEAQETNSAIEEANIDCVSTTIKDTLSSENAPVKDGTDSEVLLDASKPVSLTTPDGISQMTSANVPIESKDANENFPSEAIPMETTVNLTSTMESTVSQSDERDTLASNPTSDSASEPLITSSEEAKNRSIEIIEVGGDNVSSIDIASIESESQISLEERFGAKEIEAFITPTSTSMEENAGDKCQGVDVSKENISFNAPSAEEAIFQMSTQDGCTHNFQLKTNDPTVVCKADVVSSTPILNIASYELTVTPTTFEESAEEVQLLNNEALKLTVSDETAFTANEMVGAATEVEDKKDEACAAFYDSTREREELTRLRIVLEEELLNTEIALKEALKSRGIDEGITNTSQAQSEIGKNVDPSNVASSSVEVIVNSAAGSESESQNVLTGVKTFADSSNMSVTQETTSLLSSGKDILLQDSSQLSSQAELISSSGEFSFPELIANQGVDIPLVTSDSNNHDSLAGTEVCSQPPFDSESEKPPNLTGVVLDDSSADSNSVLALLNAEVVSQDASENNCVEMSDVVAFEQNDFIGAASAEEEDSSRRLLVGDVDISCSVSQECVLKTLPLDVGDNQSTEISTDSVAEMEVDSVVSLNQNPPSSAGDAFKVCKLLTEVNTNSENVEMDDSRHNVSVDSVVEMEVDSAVEMPPVHNLELTYSLESLNETTESHVSDAIEVCKLGTEVSTDAKAVEMHDLLHNVSNDSAVEMLSDPNSGVIPSVNEQLPKQDVQKTEFQQENLVSIAEPSTASQECFSSLQARQDFSENIPQVSMTSQNLGHDSSIFPKSSDNVHTEECSTTQVLEEQAIKMDTPELVSSLFLDETFSIKSSESILVGSVSKEVLLREVKSSTDNENLLSESGGDANVNELSQEAENIQNIEEMSKLCEISEPNERSEENEVPGNIEQNAEFKTEQSVCQQTSSFTEGASQIDIKQLKSRTEIAAELNTSSQEIEAAPILGHFDDNFFQTNSSNESPPVLGESGENSEDGKTIEFSNITALCDLHSSSAEQKEDNCFELSSEMNITETKNEALSEPVVEKKNDSDTDEYETES